MEDIEIARNTKLKKITEIAEKLNIQEEQLEQYGKFKAKISPEVYKELKNKVYTMKEYVNYDRQYHDKINIKDPWGYDIETYRSCLAEIDEVLDLLIKKIQKNV